MLETGRRVTAGQDQQAFQHPAISSETLGSSEFRKEHRVRYAYVSGAMYKGIASADLVIRMGKAGLLGYFGTGGLTVDRMDEAILKIQRALDHGESFGMNLLCNLIKPEFEDATVDLYFRRGIRRVEAAAYTQITPSLVRYRLRGISQASKGGIVVPNRILAKVSRPEVAVQFLSPPPERIVQKLREAGSITPEESALARHIAMSEDICVEADSAGHTDNGVAFALMPVMLRLRDEAMAQYGYAERIRVGAAGGIGTPHAVAAAFILGADFVLTGSINQCTVEAGTSDLAKDLLAGANVQDTEMAPAGDMFEIGAKVQVLKKGLFFPARANKLYELYKQYDSLEQIDPKTRDQIESRYFKRSFEEVYKETKDFYLSVAPEQIEKAEKNPKQKLALILRWYFIHSTRLALKGIADQKVDFQIHCGPAMGAFNQWVKGTRYEDWRNRHVDEIADMLMNGAASILCQRFLELQGIVAESASLNKLAS
jgi:trans-AT polyketide synthase/acyltransferase/oxidoreductase domain-containing protein